MPKTINKDPDAELDYTFDFAALTNGSGLKDYLQEGEQLASFEITVDDGVTMILAEMIHNNTAVIVWISGGILAEHYKIKCSFVTTSIPARKDDKTIILRMVNN